MNICPSILKGIKKYTLCAMYRPLDSYSYLPENLQILPLEQLARSTFPNSEIFIMGDFNIDFLEPKNTRDIKKLLS